MHNGGLVRWQMLIDISKYSPLVFVGNLAEKDNIDIVLQVSL